MSNQVYRNNLYEKYSPSNIVNKFEITGGTAQSIAASYSPNSIYWNKVNGVTVNPIAGVINYDAVLKSGSKNIKPIYNNAVKNFTYFQVMKSGTYTISVVFAMQGATGVNEMRGVGIAIADKNLVPEPALRGLQCQWGPSSGVVNPGPWCISATFTGYLEAGQNFFPAAISTNGINFLNDLTTHGQTTILEYFEN